MKKITKEDLIIILLTVMDFAPDPKDVTDKRDGKKYLCAYEQAKK